MKLAYAAAVAVLVVLIIYVLRKAAGAARRRGTYTVTGLPDTHTTKLLCPRQGAVAAQTATYTKDAGGATGVLRTLREALSALAGGDLYTVDSKQLLSKSASTPGSLTFSYTCPTA